MTATRHPVVRYRTVLLGVGHISVADLHCRQASAPAHVRHGEFTAR